VNVKKTLEHLSKREFNKLSKSGMFWEFYPECKSDVYEYRLITYINEDNFKKILINYGLEIGQ
jgi:hypothetical protein